jgi:hypothetical protein
VQRPPALQQARRQRRPGAQLAGPRRPPVPRQAGRRQRRVRRAHRRRQPPARHALRRQQRAPLGGGRWLQDQARPPASLLPLLLPLPLPRPLLLLRPARPVRRLRQHEQLDATVAHGAADLAVARVQR